MVAEKRILIVTGVARSGTTALAELLNSHTRLCLGVERFKFRYLREHDFSAKFFTKDRFFDFQAEDTNIRPDIREAWREPYARIAEKWDAAEVVGDKVPDLTPVLGDFIAANPGFSYLYILRNLKDVALSWQARADKARDSWPASKDFAAACGSWTAQMTALRELLADADVRDRMLVLDYDRMFGEPDATEAALLGYLGLPSDPGFKAKLASHAAFAASRPVKRVPAAWAETYQAVNQEDAKALRRHSKRQVAQWGPRAAAE